MPERRMAEERQGGAGGVTPPSDGDGGGSRGKRGTSGRESGKRPKERLTVYVPVEVVELARNAVYWTPGLTLSRLAEDGLTEAVDRLEEGRGEPFRPRGGDIKRGRPPK